VPPETVEPDEGHGYRRARCGFRKSREVGAADGGKRVAARLGSQSAPRGGGRDAPDSTAGPGGRVLEEYSSLTVPLRPPETPLASTSRLIGPDRTKPEHDRPGQLHLNPNASTSSSFAVAQVATWPGPTSAPGALWTWTRVPSGDVGPVSASALLPLAFPGTSTRQSARSSAISMSIGTMTDLSPRRERIKGSGQLGTREPVGPL
jgi:hypothetical protein